MRIALIGLALALAPAAASAAPWVLVDAAKEYVAIIDEGSITRSGSQIQVDTLAIPATGQSILTSLTFDCTANTWAQRQNRYVNSDYSLGVVMPADGVAQAVRSGTFAETVLKRVCSGVRAKPGEAGQAATLKDAMVGGRAVLAELAKGS